MLLPLLRRQVLLRKGILHRAPLDTQHLCDFLLGPSTAALVQEADFKALVARHVSVFDVFGPREETAADIVGPSGRWRRVLTVKYWAYARRAGF